MDSPMVSHLVALRATLFRCVPFTRHGPYAQPPDAVKQKFSVALALTYRGGVCNRDQPTRHGRLDLADVAERVDHGEYTHFLA